MSYQISWHRENRVLYMKLEGDMPPDELVRMEAEAFNLIKNANGIIHAIVDMRSLNNPGSLSNSLSKNKHDNQGISVIVMPNMNRIGKFIASTMMQVLRLQFRICETIEEAEAIIDKLDVRVV
jgi:hypothetical protein